MNGRSRTAPAAPSPEAEKAAGRARAMKAAEVRTRLMGLGERSVRKTYYPELRDRVEELERFRALMNQATDAILVLDAADRRLVDANETAARLTGRGLADLIGLAPDAVLDSGALQALDELLARPADEAGRELSAALRTAADGAVPCDMSLRLLSFRSRAYVLVNAKDISRRLADQRALREREVYYRAVVESFDGFVFICDESGRIEFANENFKAFLGRDATGEVCHEAVHGLPERCPWCTAGQVQDGRTARFELQDPKDGRWYQISQTPIRHADGRLSRQVLVQDITDRKEMEGRLREQALRDPLTGLANRTLCLARVEEALARAAGGDRPFSLLFVDMDRFKTLNDSLGHKFGDTLLAAVARRLEDCVDPEDTVARYGGDEFLVLLEGPSERRRAVRVAKAVREAFRRGFELEGRRVPTSASIGVVHDRSVGAATAQDLLQNADIAMQWAKSHGGDRIKVFAPSMLERARRRLVLERDMREGLEKGQFFVVFQPIVSLKGGPRLAGLEALLRWRHPERGLVSPGEFIPLAEETGQIVEIGLWVLRRACATMARFRAAEPRARGLTLAVNVSGRQFGSAAFTERVREVLEDTGLPGDRLRLEVTETAIMDNPAQTAQTLGRLKKLGLSISVDDFGRGYSSMSYLQQLPLDVLKIDLSFIRGMLESQADMEIVKAIINLAHNLDLAVVAEGVEKREQQSLLMLLDCEYAQGFLYARPQDEGEALQTIRTYAPALPDSGQPG